MCVPHAGARGGGQVANHGDRVVGHGGFPSRAGRWRRARCVRSPSDRPTRLGRRSGNGPARAVADRRPRLADRLDWRRCRRATGCVGCSGRQQERGDQGSPRRRRQRAQGAAGPVKVVVVCDVVHPQQVAGDDADLVAGLSQSIDHGCCGRCSVRAVGDSCVVSSRSGETR